MAAKPKVPFEKSAKDRELKRFGREGSAKEEAFDKKQAAFKCGGAVKKSGRGR